MYFMVNSKNLHLFLAIHFYLLHDGISEPGKDIEVVLEKIAGCDSEKKVCTFNKESNLDTLVGFYGKTDVKTRKQQLHFINGDTGETKTYDDIFCNYRGMPVCPFLTGEYQVLESTLTLESSFSMSYGTLKWKIYNDKYKSIWVSQYSFS
ncbi:hypothetical protein MXB_5279, partial [Myxobolus squamalis]